MNRVLLAAHLAMCSGQGRDIAFESEPRVTMEDYRAMIGGKTAALFGAACELGALAAGADARAGRRVRAAGRAYGIAFQIEDDMLGTWGDSATTGKPCGDLAKRKWTFPVVWALAGPPSPARETIAAAYARGAELDPADVAATVAALDRLGARDAAQRRGAGELAAADAVADGARASTAAAACARSSGAPRGGSHERVRARVVRAGDRGAQRAARRSRSILGAGLILRLLFIGSDGFHNDVAAFESWTLTLRDNPPWQFYAKTGFADYPPGYFVVLWVLAKIYALARRAPTTARTAGRSCARS